MISPQIEHEVFLQDGKSTSLPIVSRTTERHSLRPTHNSTKPIPTKIMMQETIKTLSTSSRKGFSLYKIRKFILQNYLHATHELKQRLPFMKKFFKQSLERGRIVSVKGTGLNGSFRVPPTSPWHKNANQNMRKIIRENAEKRLKKINKNEKVQLAKSKKVNVKRNFSANI